MEQENIKHLFKRTLVNFLDEIINILPSEPDLIVARIYVNDKSTPEDLLNFFILNFSPHRKAIETKNEKVFLDSERDNKTGKSIFGSLSDDKINHFKYLWRSGVINNDNKEVIWKWLNSFIKIMDKYQTS